MLLANCPTAISIKYIQDNFKSAILLKVWHNGPLPLEERKKIGGFFSYAAGKLSHCHQVLTYTGKFQICHPPKSVAQWPLPLEARKKIRGHFFLCCWQIVPLPLV